MLSLIPLLPLVGFLVNACLGRRLTKSISGGLACAAMIASFAVVGHAGLAHPADAPPAPIELHRRSRGFASGTLHVPFTLRLDHLSSVMILVDHGHRLAHPHLLDRLHARGEDSEYARYFSYLNLFASFMLVLVLGRELPGDVRRLGRGRPLLVPADRLLVPQAVGRRRRQESVHRQPHRRLRLHPGDAADLRDLRHAGLPAGRRRRRRRARSSTARWA